MSESDYEWGPWQPLNGSGVPDSLPLDTPLRFLFAGDGLRPNDELVSPKWPGFYWSWKRVRVGWFKTELRRVCDNPRYAPIFMYRVRKPRRNLYEMFPIHLEEDNPTPAPNDTERV